MSTDTRLKGVCHVLDAYNLIYINSIIKEDMLANTKLYVKNILSKKTNRKIVVIYVDDFGSIRTKNIEAKDNLSALGIPMEGSRYSFDTLLSNEDFGMLYDVLTSVKDKNGHHACFTPFANIANPDFDRIKESGFQKYFREPFVKTLERYGSSHNEVYSYWKQGIVENIFRPEYHGTEHLNVHRFIKALQDGHKSTLLAFENESVCMRTFPGETEIRRASGIFAIDKAEENESLCDDLKVGLNMFEDLLGYRSTQFTPGGGMHSCLINKELYDNGIKYVHVGRTIHYPLGDGKFKTEHAYTGKQNNIGQTYIVRNCPFETIFDNCKYNNSVVKICLDNIEAAFRMHNLALVSTHRVNFAGSIDSEHRDNAMKQLRLLLSEIVKRWPDVEFMSGQEMTQAIFE